MSRTKLLSFSILFLILAGFAHHVLAEEGRIIRRRCKGLDESLGKLPLHFIENLGQVHEEAAYYVQGYDKYLYFTSKGITFVLTDMRKVKGVEGKIEAREGCRMAPSKKVLRPRTVHLDFIGADPAVSPRGEEKKKAVFSYFKGKREAWKPGVSSYGRVVYPDLWPGIDLIYHGTVNRLKYEFRVKPGADPEWIRLAYRGADQVDLTKAGGLKVETPAGGFEDGRPYAWQVIDGTRKEVFAAYQPRAGVQETDFAYGFAVGAYDPEKTLILDPVIIVYCGYLGGLGSDVGYGIAADSEGNTYITGVTGSVTAGFPAVTGPDLHFNGGSYDAFVAKINHHGNELLYCGYIGGSDVDQGFGIAVDADGNAYVTGVTGSTHHSFPVVNGPCLKHGGGWDAFVAKVNADGTDLEYCGYIGGNMEDQGFGIAVDSAGNACVTGATRSKEDTFPVVMGPGLFNTGDYDAFVAKVNAEGTGFLFSGFYGGALKDVGNGIAVDKAGNVYITGLTKADEYHISIPLEKGPFLNSKGGFEAFVAKIRSVDSMIMYSGFISGKYYDEGCAVAVDDSNYAYVTGITNSSEVSFPVTVGPDKTYKGGYDAFVAKIAKKGTSVEYCGYLGGTYYDKGLAITVDGKDRAYVAGVTASLSSSFPVIDGPDLTYNGGAYDAFTARLNPKGSNLEYCGYIGGKSEDWAFGIALDRYGNTYVTGKTGSDGSGFPVFGGPDSTYNGYGDVFLAKVNDSEGLCTDTNTISAATGGYVNFYLHGEEGNALKGYILLGTLSGTDPGMILHHGKVTLPINWDSLTEINLMMLNTEAFKYFLADLNGSGTGYAQFNTISALTPDCVGLKLHFAYALDSWDFASNAVQVDIVP